MRLKYLLLATTLGAGPVLAQAPEPARDTQDPPATEPLASAQTTEAEPEIVVVGTQIRGSRVTEALPVSVLDRNQIDATGALSGDDLIRAIPQMGEVAFNPSNNPQT